MDGSRALCQEGALPWATSHKKFPQGKTSSATCSPAPRACQPNPPV
jgi:hypothetical protein